VEITVPWFVDQKFFSVSVLRDLYDLCGETLLGLRRPRYVSIRLEEKGVEGCLNNRHAAHAWWWD
jgi:hypothetical protein